MPKYTMEVRTIGTTRGWKEEVSYPGLLDPRTLDEAEFMAKEIIDRFNRTLRPREEPREVLGVEEIEGSDESEESDEGGDQDDEQDDGEHIPHLEWDH